MSSKFLASRKKLISTKKVGLVIHTGSHLFSSGIVQNAYFIVQCFENMGMKCELLAYGKEEKPFGYKDVKVKPFWEDITIFNPDEYFMVMTVTRGIDQHMYQWLKKWNVIVVSFICGNNIMHDQEDFVRGFRTENGGGTFIDYRSTSDELWVIPEYKHSLPYLETTRRTKAEIVPHLWTPEIFKEFHERNFKMPEEKLFYNPKTHTGKKIEIIILESNIALFKNAWIPLIACEKLHLQNKDLFEYVFAFNYPDSNYAWGMADNLAIEKDKKLRRFKRLALPEILLKFNHNETVPIIVSFQMNNSLNYLYYECLYYGFPLVHNSPDLEGSGYYYPDMDVAKCGEQILNAYINHNDSLENYNKTARKFLKKVDPFDDKVCKIWETRIEALLKKMKI